MNKPSVDDFYDPDYGECSNCHGEGVVPMCEDEWACADPESGCEFCMVPCEFCSGDDR